MLSTPPARTSSQAPVCTCMQPLITACSAEPQRRSICDAGHVDGQSRVERRDAADRRRLAVRRALAQHDVVDVLAAQPGPGHQLADHRRGQGRGVDVPEDAAEAPDRRAQRLADDRLAGALRAHRVLPVRLRCDSVPIKAGSL